MAHREASSKKMVALAVSHCYRVHSIVGSASTNWGPLLLETSIRATVNVLDSRVISNKRKDGSIYPKGPSTQS